MHVNGVDGTAGTTWYNIERVFMALSKILKITILYIYTNTKVFSSCAINYCSSSDCNKSAIIRLLSKI